MRSNSRQNKRWTPDELATMEELILEGATAKKVAKVLGRTKASVVSKKWEQGIHEFRFPKPKKRKPRETGIPKSPNSAEGVNTAIRDLGEAIRVFKQRTGLEVNTTFTVKLD